MAKHSEKPSVMQNKKNLSIGLSIHMHDEIQEAIRAINSFLKYHPSCEVSIWGNEPPELRIVGAHFNKSTIDSPQYVNDLLKILRHEGNYDSIKACNILKEFLFCAKGVYQSMSSEYVIFLHPDHLVVRPFTSRLLKGDLEISKVNKYTKNQKDAWLSVTGKPLKIKAYGLAGYYHRESLLAAINLLLDDSIIDLKKLLEADVNFICEDLIIPCAFDYLGYEIVGQNITLELKRRKSLRKYLNKHVLLHQLPKINTNQYRE